MPLVGVHPAALSTSEFCAVTLSSESQMSGPKPAVLPAMMVFTIRTWALLQFQMPPPHSEAVLPKIVHEATLLRMPKLSIAPPSSDVLPANVLDWTVIVPSLSIAPPTRLPVSPLNVLDWTVAVP